MPTIEESDPLACYWVNDLAHVIGPDIDAMRRAVSAITGSPYSHADLRCAVSWIGHSKGCDWLAPYSSWVEELVAYFFAAEEWEAEVAAITSIKLELLGQPLPADFAKAAVEIMATSRAAYRSRDFDFFPEESKRGWRQRKLRRGSPRWRIAIEQWNGLNYFSGEPQHEGWFEHISHDANGNALVRTEHEVGDNPFLDFEAAFIVEIETRIADYLLADITEGRLREEVFSRLKCVLGNFSYPFWFIAKAFDKRERRKGH